MLSQVVLSLQLAFAVVPLVTFTSDRARMGRFVNPPWVVVLASLVTLVIIGLNANLVRQTLGEWLASAGPRAPLLWATVVPLVAALMLLLAWLVLAPIAGRFAPALLRREPDRVPAPSGGAVFQPGRTIAENVPYRRVAVALELAEPDRDILEHVRRMALPAAAELVLMHVAESAASRYLGTESSDEESREDRATLDALAAEFRARGIGASVMLGNGDVKRELARMVNASGVDLLITGSHGHGIVGDLFHGATTSGLRHRVRCPVLVVRSTTRPRS